MGPELFNIPSLEFLQTSGGLLPETTALAVVTTIAYLSGRRIWNRKRAKLDAKHEYEIKRTTEIAEQLEETASTLRHELNLQLNHFAHFKRRLSEACEKGDVESWEAILANADQILEPTLQFAKSLSSAYGSIREHAYILESFAQDLPTHQSNKDNVSRYQSSVEELMNFARSNSYTFSIAAISLDHDPGDLPSPALHQDQPSLSKVGQVIDSLKLDPFFIAEHRDEELILVMPQTNLSGAGKVGELIRGFVAERLRATISCGFAEYCAPETGNTLLMRARSALYSAKAVGSNQQAAHDRNRLVKQLSDEAPLGTASPTSALGEQGLTAPLSTPETERWSLDSLITYTASNDPDTLAESSTLDLISSLLESEAIDCYETPFESAVL